MSNRAAGDSSRSRGPFADSPPPAPSSLGAGPADVRAADGSSMASDMDSNSDADVPLAFGGEPSLAIHDVAWAAPDDQPTRISKRPPAALQAVDNNRSADLAHLLAGQQLEHFRLEEFVGGGGMGAVFRAVDTRLDRQVAVKVLSREQAADEETVRRFHNEAQSAARLDHENIARVFYVGEDRGWHFIAFEFIEGRNVRDLVLERGPLPVADAISYILQVAEALAHASGRDVVHRDIKPSNILITNEGRAKLVDMGLARLHQVERSSGDLTASGVTLGTFDYISPEQARDPRSADVRSDIYSLGCTLYFMLCGRPPFPDGTVLQKLLQHQGDAAPDLCQLNPAVAPELSTLVARMMAKDPSQRPQTPHELVAQLVALAAQLGLEPASAATTVVWTQPTTGAWTRFQQNLPWIVPAVVLVMCVAAIEFVSSFRATNLGSPDNAIAGLPVLASQGTSGNGAGRGEGPAPTAPGNEQSIGPPASANKNARMQSGAPQGIGHAPEGVAKANPPRNSTSPPAEPLVAPAGDTTAETKTNVDGSFAAPFAETAETTTKVGPAPGLAENAVGENTSTLPDAAHPLLGVLEEVGLAGEGTSATAAAPTSAGIGSALAIHGQLQASNSVPTVDAPSRTPAGVAVPPPSQPGLLVVDPTAEAAQTFASLEAACAAARSGDVIELRYNGRLEERPIQLENLKLTIRAGDQYRPVVAFHPRDADPVEYPRHMLTVTGGRLTLINVALELDLSQELPADGWSLFRVRQAESVELENCSLTIGNATSRQRVLHAEVSFIEVVALAGQGATNSSPIEPLSLKLTNCIARGEADFLHAEDLQPCSLVWNNGLLVTTQRLLVATGGRATPAGPERLHLDLRHLTAVVRSGFCLLTNSTDGPRQLDAVIQCTNSILLVEDAAALIEQSGIDTVEAFRRRVRWESERNFYDGFHIFWKIRGQSQLDAPQEMTLSAWRAFWQGQEKSWGRVLWRQLPDPSRPLHQHTPADYALDTRVADNAAVRGATDGRNAGCEANLLPPLPLPASSNGRSAQGPSSGGVLR
ncbi:MAG: protein kinase [Pirellulales bacterium]|nr:protein kinase [Pirellulales bacterium]